jgi:hypothetical protein
MAKWTIDFNDLANKKEDLKFYLNITGSLLKAVFQTAAHKALPSRNSSSEDNQIIAAFKSLDETKEALYQRYPEKVTSDQRSTTYWSFKTVLIDQLAQKGWPVIQSSAWDEQNPQSERDRFVHCEISNTLGALMRCGNSEIMLRFELNELGTSYPKVAPLLRENIIDLIVTAEELGSVAKFN